MLKRTVNTFVKVTTNIILITILILGVFFSFKLLIKRAYPLEYYDIVRKYSEEYGVEKSFVYAVIKSESNFNQYTVSDAGAIGLMQITPDTFYWLQYRMKSEKRLDEEYLFDSEVNIKHGVYFLSILLDKYDDYKVVLSAYNAGMGAVDKWLDNEEISDDGITLKNIPYGQTDRYVNKVIEAKKIYESIYKLN